MEDIPKEEMGLEIESGFDFMDWIDSKISGVTLQEFLKSRASVNKKI